MPMSKLAAMPHASQVGDQFARIALSLALAALFLCASITHALPPPRPLEIKSLRIGTQKTLVVTTNIGAYISVNDGADWSAFSFPYSWNVGGKGVGDVYKTKPVNSDKSTLEFISWFPPSPGPFATAPDGNRHSCSGDVIYESSDRGMRWKAVSTLPRPPEGMGPINLCHAVLWADNTLFAGTLHGLYASKTGREWESATANPVVRQAAIDFLVADTTGNVYVNLRNTRVEDSKGSYKSSDGGKQWNRVNFGIHPTSEDFVPTIVGIVGKAVYASSHAGLIVSTDSGGSWTPMNIGLLTQPKGDTVPWDVVSSVQADAAGNLYATTSRQIYKWPAGGNAWLPLGRKGIPLS